ncbi:Nose resistant to fluoxetine protein 6, partial [Stegodyphus mimosarum]
MEQVKLNSAVILIFLITSFLIVFCYGTSDSNSRDHDHLEEEYEIKKWEENFRKIKKVTGTVIKTAMPYLMSGVSSENLHLSAECRRALLLWVSDLRSLKPWALRMVDASAKMMNGILTGTLSAFGSFDQCVEISVPNRGFQGQYCSIEAWPPLPPKPRFYALNQRLKAFEKFENDTGVMGEFTKYVQLFYMFPFRVGVCVPSACSTSDVFNVSTFVSQSIFPVNISIPRCETKEVAVVQDYQIPMLCVIGVLIMLVLCGTLVDTLIIRKKNVAPSESGLVLQFLLAFSAISNFKKLMDVNAASDALTALHGIRFYSMCWIILGHTYFHLNFNTLRYLQITIEMASQFAFNFITNSSLVVDNFFFLSGLLMIYVALDMEKKTGRIPNAVHFIIHRLWRFLPVQMFFVG